LNKRIAILSRLIRIKLTLAVALSATIGYVFSGAGDLLTALMVALGVLLLSSASSVLNQIQELKQDALMARTAQRPIPSGEITAKQAMLIFLILLFAGAVALLGVNLISAIVGISTILLYNGFYTPLKKKTSLAIFPGALVGALPPMIGWVGAGEPITHPAIIMLSGFMFLWQIPHFLLLAIKYREQYLNAGFQVSVGAPASKQTRRLLLLWVLTTSFAALFFPFFGLVQNTFIVAAIILLNCLLIFAFFRIAFTNYEMALKGKLHGFVSIYMLLFLLLIAADSLILNL